MHEIANLELPVIFAINETIISFPVDQKFIYENAEIRPRIIAVGA